MDPTTLARDDGVTKTVYSIYWPLTRGIVESVWADERDELHAQFEEPWTKKQDALHDPYLQRWTEWATPLQPRVTKRDFPFWYPTNGSSEALRETLADFAAHRRGNALHVFRGDYEGYEAYAQGYGVPAVHHDRAALDKEDSLRPGDIFMLSQPSAIDGNFWPGYDGFLRHMAERHPQVEVMVDLCYVGLLARDYAISVDHPNISRLFFSLSKIFGVYYHRIGGAFSKREIAGLYGNMWFKNLHSIHLARRLLDATTVTTIPRLYRGHQQAVIRKLQNRFPALHASDALLLGYHAFETDRATEMDRLLRRDAVVRYCLSPAIDAAIRAGTT